MKKCIKKLFSIVLIALLITLNISFTAFADFAQQSKVTASNGASDDEVGYSVSISGNYAVIGAPYHTTSGPNSGAAYVYQRSGTSWNQVAILTASDADANRRFGYSVGISGDYVIVGAPENSSNNGSAYIFEKPGGGWSNMTQTQKITASDGATNDDFGDSVSISGSYAVVGAHYDDDKGSDAGTAFVFERSGTWSQVAKLTASDGAGSDEFGISVDISGDYVVVGAKGDDSSQGAAYIYEKPGGGWSNMTQTGKLTSSVEQNNDLMGSSVAISGDYIIVGAPGDGTNTGIAYVFEKPGGGWGDATEDASLESSDAAKNEYFGTSVAISSGHAVVGCPIIDTTKGAAYVFEKPGGGWSDASEDQKLSGADSAAGDEFGNAVDISGDYFISGAHDDSNSEGSAYIFYNSTSSVPEFSPYIYITTIFFGLMLIYIFRPKTA